MRRFLSSIAAAVILLVGGASAASAASAGPATAAVRASVGAERASTGAVAAPKKVVGPAPRGPLDTCSAEPFRGDPRLGPADLPLLGEVGRQLRPWWRTGPYQPAQFLDLFWDPASRSWRYPPQDGFVLRTDATPQKAPTDLRPGQEIDRYGAEGGRFLAPDDTPYARRAIPPSNLVGVPAAACDYHEYRVLRPFTVWGGPIAPWFGQPGGGVQYQLDGSLIPGAPARVDVTWLLAHGYLARVR